MKTVNIKPYLSVTPCTLFNYAEQFINRYYTHG